MGVVDISLKLAIAALQPLDIPVSTYTNDGKIMPYAVVSEVLEQPEIYADDGEWLTGYHVQVDFVGKTNLEKLVRKATRLLTAAGFIRKMKRAEYVKDAKAYRHMLHLFIATDYEEEEDEQEEL